MNIGFPLQTILGRQMVRGVICHYCLYSEARSYKPVSGHSGLYGVSDSAWFPFEDGRPFWLKNGLA
jgi:hypothetical protein